MLPALIEPSRAIKNGWYLTAWLLICLGTFCVWGLIDDRALENGDSVALKPLKFALSLSVHMATLCLIGVWTQRAARGDAWFGAMVNVQCLGVVLEMMAITTQAARGVESHFNSTTPFDAFMFTLMGIGVLIMSLSFLGILIGLVRKPAAEFIKNISVSLGIAAMLAGFVVGVIMVQPTPEQAQLLAQGINLTAVGAHGPSSTDTGFPVLGWSYEVSDWRAPHFVGIHALQALPLLAFILMKCRLSDDTCRFIFSALSGFYLGVFAFMVSHTLRGKSIFQVDHTLLLFCVAGFAVGSAVLLATRQTRRLSFAEHK